MKNENDTRKVSIIVFTLLLLFSLGLPILTGLVNGGDEPELNETPRFQLFTDQAHVVHTPLRHNVYELEEVKVIGTLPPHAKQQDEQSFIGIWRCFYHQLVQGGSPSAPDVKVCEREKH